MGKLMLTLLFPCAIFAQTTIFNADFGNAAGDNSWTDDNVSATWLRGTDALAHGTGKYKYIERDDDTSVFGTVAVNSYATTETPNIDLTGYERLTLSLRMRYDTESTFDGVRILFSNDGGTTYYPLGKENDEAINWYNDTSVNAIDAIARGWSGWSSGWFSASIDLPSQGFDDMANVRFMVEFANDGFDGTYYQGIAFDDFKIIGYPITPKVYPTASCAIWDKQELWLKPQSLSGLNDNDKVDRWENSALINPDWTDAQSTGVLRPTYNNDATNNVNFNAVVTFDATNSMFGREGFYNQDIYLVIKPGTPISATATTQDVFLGDDYLEISGNEDVTGVSINDTSVRFGTASDIAAYNQGAQDQYGKAFTSATLSYDRPVIFNARLNAAGTGMDLFLDGVNLDLLGSTSEVLVGTFKNILNSRYWLGRSEFYGESFNGDILEVMVFSERKTDTERQKIESYLGVKYGVTLGLFPDLANGIPHVPGAYFDSAGIPLWNPVSDTGYTYNVAAIGRDDCVSLYQKQAKSIDPNTFITVGLEDIYTTNEDNPNTFANDKDFLMWGSTPSTLTALPSPLSVNLGPSLVTTFTDVTERTWKFKEVVTTDIPTVKLSVSTAGLSALPAITGNDAYVMIVADDDAFTTNVETVFLTTNGASQECFYDFDGVKYVKFGVAHEVVSPRHIEFDGENDYVKIGDKINQTGTFSVTAWVNTSGSNNDNSEKTIISKRGNSSDGYHFYLADDNKVTMQYGSLATQKITSNTVLSNNQWRHVSFTFDGSVGKLYIDGVLDNTTNLISPISNTNSFCIGARFIDKNNIENHFYGNLEEIRIFNEAISVEEIRFTMNQEIEQNGTLIEGKILPNTITKNDLNGRTWSTLSAYFNMNTYIGTHLNDASGNGHRGALLVPENFNIKEQTAPLPYTSINDGDWSDLATWENGTSMYAPDATLNINGTNTTIDWNIVKTNNDIDLNNNVVVLGLFNESNKLVVKNGSKIEVSHYLKLDGEIDLTGRSQLVQTLDSDLDITSSGFIERDQQGHTNKFNYNYFSLPVGLQSTVSNNTSYVLSSNLKDATNVNSLENINWIDDNDSAAGSPINLSRNWLYKYVNTAPDYYSWLQFDENDQTLAGQGFTMKGSNAATVTQNYTFVGKPNNGEISLAIGANNSSLLGNPYPSALDATAFINDNSTSITGTLYFWEHYTTNLTHVTSDYQGGYAMRNLTGGTPPVALPMNSGLGSSTKVPQRYVPVAQGFFVDGSATGGNVIFNNNQRLFVKEDNTNSNTVFRSSNSNAESQDDYVEEDNTLNLRLGITSVSGHKRQLLLGFIGTKASNNFDYGYDGDIYDALPSDAYFKSADNHNLIIQGVGGFNTDSIFPITVKSNEAGLVKFNLDEIFEAPVVMVVYIHDSATDLYYNIRNQSVSLPIDAGTTDGRFSLRFRSENNLSVNDYEAETLSIFFLNNSQYLVIYNPTLVETVDEITLYTILGQKVKEWNLIKEDQSFINLPIKNMSSGAYLAKVQTVSGKVITKKILIN